MHTPLRHFALLCMLVISASQANAAARIACVAEDKSISLALNAELSGSQGDALTGVSGAVRDKREVPLDTGTSASNGGTRKLDRQSVAQYWFQDASLKLLIVEDGGPSGKAMPVSMLLDLKQVRTDPATYRGRYELRSHTPNSKPAISGYAECSVE